MKRGILSQKLLPYLGLVAAGLFLMLIPLGKGEFFGSEGDWYSQHVGAAEALRQTMLASGSLLPQYLPLGGGCSSYDFAYYGLLRPDVVVSCLVPGLAMKYVIAAYAMAGMTASLCLCFYWLKKQGRGLWFALAGALLLGASTCFFHAHHQIMFVNYMPFLILALIGIDRLLEKGRSGLLIVGLFMGFLHSFYYGPACLFVCLIYLLYQAKKPLRLQGKVLFKGVAAFAVSVGMAGVLLLPTALDILSTAKDGGVFTEEPLRIVDFSMSGLLYSPYGCGLTLLALYCLILSLTVRPRRILAAVLIGCVAIPAVALALNGFLYARGKILIPLVPLLVMICAQTLEELWQKKQRALIWPALVCLFPAVFSQWRLGILADGIVLLLWVVLQRACLPSPLVRRTAFALILAVPVGLSVGANLSETYIQADDTRQSIFSGEEIAAAADNPLYRFDYISDSSANCNFPPAGSVTKTGIYTSVNEAGYSEFFYDTMKNPISIQNRVALLPSENCFFSYFMGIRYVSVEEGKLPWGYESVYAKDGYVLAENKNVLPICYGTDNLLSEEAFERLEFPHTLEALSTAAVVPETATGEFTSHVEERDLLTGDFAKGCSSREGLTVSENKTKNFTIPLREPLSNQALIVSFDVERLSGEEAVVIINGVKNKLSSAKAPYPNRNNTFTYVLTGEAGETDKLTVSLSKGHYKISNLMTYTMDLKYLNHEGVTVPKTLQGEPKDGKTVFKGEINMDEAGWFITSYPYRKGYTALVDGEKTQIQKVNTTFVGFPLGEGTHRVEIDYTAPGYEAGLALSAGALAAFIRLIIRERKREK